MILRPLQLPVTLLFLLPSLIAAQDNPFDCQNRLAIQSLSFDLSKLAGEHSISRTRETPPSTVVDEVRFNVCSDLKALEGVSEHDQCPTGTRACLTQTNKKGSENDRIVSVIPVAQSSVLQPESAALSSSEGFKLTFHASSYPASADSQTQSFELNVLCAHDSDAAEPVVTSYDGRVVSVEWKSTAGCSSNSNEDAEKPPSNDDTSGQGSGIGWFFLALFLAFLAYFGLGAYYNYSTYGATGVDLIPHRDFWQEVPHMARDVVSHLCSSVRPQQKSSRGGYIAV
ncbi:hypothetical protein FIBSPDRAFT_810007 [Athelia psychrophila]|uniref:Autophagy-related protein 27 n=1 Tax=Athelia psychrophila TaxID=1759441 RepID=A0A166XBV9_9AGAM|nr:hypothetical protein FIBSPDRAFT_810007 [Fibularhizoctonia sp. CBS 109695]